MEVVKWLKNISGGRIFAGTETLLFQNGAVVNDKDDESLTPLHYTAMRGNLSAAKQLLKWPGIDIEVRLPGSTTHANIS